MLLAAPLLNPLPAEAASGGPDSYGYIWVDSLTPSPILTYNWVDITSTGSKLTLGDDDCSLEMSLGFQFRYYGAANDRVFICSNGFMSMGVPASYSATPPIPDPLPPNNRIVALGMDINPAKGAGVYIKSYPTSSPRRFIVTWDRIPKVYTTQLQTFQLILEQNQLSKDGRIVMQYKDVNGLTTPPLVGIENATGSSGLAYTSLITDGLAVAFLPPTDAALPPDFMQATGSSLAPATVAQGDKNVPMMAVDFTVTTNDALVRAIEVTLSGQGAGPEDVALAKLWLDDGDNVFTPGPPDIFLAQTSFSGSPPAARMMTSIHVTMSAPVRVYVSYDIGMLAGVDDWIGARLAGANAISVEYPDKLLSTGLPFDTYSAGVCTRILASVDMLRIRSYASLAPATAPQWATDVPAFSLLLDVNQNLVDISGMDVQLGSSAVASDIWLVKALRDLDADGNYTPGTDELLAMAVPGGGPPKAHLSMSLRVVSGHTERVLIVVDVAPFATVGNAMNLNMLSSMILLPAGSVDTVNATNFPVAGGNCAIVAGARPTLYPTWPTYSPRPEGIWQENEYTLNPVATVELDRVAGNNVTGHMTVENNASHLFMAIDAEEDLFANQTDGMTVGFDTDSNGVGTHNGDDVFQVNATEGQRLRYRNSLGTWGFFDWCSPAPPLGPIAVPSCAAGFGATAFLTEHHRFYEIAIPLTEIGVTLPIAPGTRLRFALAPAPFNGLRDEGNRSTWPLVFTSSPSLTQFGDIALATGPTPNSAPVLDWVGDPGYQTDALEPEAGTRNTTYTWRISYSDVDNDRPALDQPVVHVLRDGVEALGGPFRMSPENRSDFNYRDGNRYERNLTGLECGGTYTYYITVRDANGLSNTTAMKIGPQIVCPDMPPTLLGGSVTPVQGIVGSSFAYRVVYQDPENATPVTAGVTISWGGTDIATVPLNQTDWVADPGNYTAGAVYAAFYVLNSPATNYSFQFTFSDQNNTVLSPIFFGPYVLAEPPDMLNVAGVDLAPFIVDEGARLVPFLHLILFTTSPEVNVTAMRVGQTGTASAVDIDSVLLYNDTDGSGTVTPLDELLGEKPVASGNITFPLSLHVTQPRPISLLLMVNVSRPATPDVTIELELKDRMSLSVGPDDAVQAFTTFRSTKALINVPPWASGLAVDGFADGTHGIGHLLSHTPRLDWQFHDLNGWDLSQSAFNVSVHSVSPPAVFWYSNLTGGTTTATYGGPPLVDGGAYEMSVAVSDGRLWSPVAVASFRLNSPPPLPVLFLPANASIDAETTPSLVWQPVTDAEGDAVTYNYWIDDDAGFASAIMGTTQNASVTLQLDPGTTYYWRLSATDGLESRGNTTVWHFKTAGLPPPPVRGEVRGRVMEGSNAFEGALVELLMGGSVLKANVTGASGTFRFLSLDLRAYSVRVSAFGFQTQMFPVEPKVGETIVDLGDVMLVRTGGGGETGGGVPSWLIALVVVLSIAVVALLVLFLFWLKPRKKKGQAAAVKKEAAKPQAPKQPPKQAVKQAPKKETPKTPPPPKKEVPKTQSPLPPPPPPEAAPPGTPPVKKEAPEQPAPQGEVVKTETPK